MTSSERPSSSWKSRIAIAVALILLGALGWAAFAPVEVRSREALFEIPAGTSARRMAGEHLDILPQTIHLTLGVSDVLVLRNADSVPHIFGPTMIMPGQSFSLPFAKASTYSFMCTAHPTGQLDVVVDPGPTAGWRRLRWRWRQLVKAIAGPAVSPGRRSH
jgi:hypothetical protein